MTKESHIIDRANEELSEIQKAGPCQVRLTRIKDDLDHRWELICESCELSELIKPLNVTDQKLPEELRAKLAFKKKYGTTACLQDLLTIQICKQGQRYFQKPKLIEKDEPYYPYKD